jgi:AcrR family transcriptional regulator
MPTTALAPQQARSRESLRKLLKAAAEVLGQHGLEGATIPRIAAHAGLTPGAVYRRFKDKDALFEAVILGILERQDERLLQQLTPETAGQIPMAVFADQLIGGMVTSYRANASLLRAIRLFVQGRAKTPFWRKACRIETQSFERIVNFFLAHAGEMSHPDPRLAVATGLMFVTSTLVEVVVMPTDLGPVKAFLPPDDQALKRELLRAFLSYLGFAAGHTKKGRRLVRG